MLKGSVSFHSNLRLVFVPALFWLPKYTKGHLSSFWEAYHY